jgi:hypothetical protein
MSKSEPTIGACVFFLVCRVKWPQVLLLECVKEVDDAFTLMEVLQEHSLPLLQVRCSLNVSGSTAVHRTPICQPAQLFTVAPLVLQLLSLHQQM